MKSLIARVSSTYKKEGLITLLKKISQKIYRDTHFKLLALRGRYSLTLADHSVSFSAPSSKVVHRNRERFYSEKKILQDVIQETENDDIVYDVGANTGLYTLFAAKACPDGGVVAFEPYPPNFDLLKQDVDRNQLHNVELFDVALSDSVGKVIFDQPDQDDVGYGSPSIEANESESTVKVSTTTGDQLIANDEISSPNIIKIDVEGSEPLVIEGLKRTLCTQNCRTVYCEVHLSGEDHRPSVEDFGSSPEDVKSRLEEFGFTVERLGIRDREILYKGTK